MNFLLLTYSCKDFSSARTAVVGVDESFEYIGSYVLPAKRKLCKEIGISENDIAVFDFLFLGNELVFVK